MSPNEMAGEHNVTREVDNNDVDGGAEERAADVEERVVVDVEERDIKRRKTGLDDDCMMFTVPPVSPEYIIFKMPRPLQQLTYSFVVKSCPAIDRIDQKERRPKLPSNYYYVRSLMETWGRNIEYHLPGAVVSFPAFQNIGGNNSIESNWLCRNIILTKLTPISYEMSPLPSPWKTRCDWMKWLDSNLNIHLTSNSLIVLEYLHETVANIRYDDAANSTLTKDKMRIIRSAFKALMMKISECYEAIGPNRSNVVSYVRKALTGQGA